MYNQNRKQSTILYLKKNPEKRYSTTIRIKLLLLLGDKCVRCGFSDVRALQIDHINGGGKQEMKKFGTNIVMYQYYVKNPEEAKQKLQILCANCNWIKRYENQESCLLYAQN